MYSEVIFISHYNNSLRDNVLTETHVSVDKKRNRNSVHFTKQLWWQKNLKQYTVENSYF